LHLIDQLPQQPRGVVEAQVRKRVIAVEVLHMLEGGPEQVRENALAPGLDVHGFVDQCPGAGAVAADQAGEEPFVQDVLATRHSLKLRWAGASWFAVMRRVDGRVSRV